MYEKVFGYFQSSVIFEDLQRQEKQNMIKYDGTVKERKPGVLPQTESQRSGGKSKSIYVWGQKSFSFIN